eukprot:6492189-Amphidinium_carterae.6
MNGAQSSDSIVGGATDVAETQFDQATDLEAVDHGPNAHAARPKQRAKKAGRPRTRKSTVAEVIAAARAFNIATTGSSGEPSAAQVERPTVVPTIDRDVGIAVPAALGHSALGVERPGSFLSVVLAGYTLPSVNTDALLAAVQKVRRMSVEEDVYKKLQDHFFDCQHPPHQVSAIATAAKLGVAYETMYAKVCNLANAEVIAARHSRHMLEKTVSSYFNMPDKLIFVDTWMYDETPLKLTLREATGGGSLGSVLDDSHTGQRSDAFAMSTLAGKTKSQGLKAKVLQSSQHFSMLLKTTELYIHLRGNTVNPLLALNKCTSEAIKSGLARWSGLSKHTEDFAQRLRVAVVDRAGANMKAEHSIAADQAGLKACQSPCQVHMTSGAIAKSIDAVYPEQVHGIMHLSLALKEAGAMVAFRAALRTELQQRVVIKRGQVNEEARKWRESVMTIFTSAYSHNELEQALLSKLPNGDWRVPEVQYFVPHS